MSQPGHGIPSAYRELVQDAREAGWRIRLGRHIVMYAPDGGTIITLPKTPSDHRSIKNSKALVRRSTRRRTS